MSINQILSDNLLYSFDGPNWTDVSVAETLKSINYNQAQIKTDASPNTIAGLVHHLLFWNKIIIQRIKGLSPAIPEINGFDVEKLDSEEDWKMLVEKTRESFVELATAIKLLPVEQWKNPSNNGTSTVEENLFGIIEHAYYHLGQIVMLKHLVQQ